MGIAQPVFQQFGPVVGIGDEQVKPSITVPIAHRKAATTTGLHTTVNVIRRVYDTGRRVAAAFKAAFPIVFDARLPKWNYRAIPPCSIRH